ncbi:hypothetical protein GGE24_007412 [Bradyrhizobium centrosematis]|nr:hypothetical protein [Bradyrhizobium centrosematis]MCS3778037.1 hypothetical protein [Bradyrhizobium centrosematis]
MATFAAGSSRDPDGAPGFGADDEHRISAGRAERKDESYWRPRLRKLRGNGARLPSAIDGTGGRGRKQAIMRMERTMGEFRRHRQPGGKVHHVDGARRDDLRNAVPAGIHQTVRAGVYHRAHHLVGDLLKAEVEHRGKSALRCDRLHRTAAHAGGVEHHDLVAASLELRLQLDHLAEAALTERGQR